MAKRELPSPELLRQLLDYDPETGELAWRERSLELFRSGKKSAGHGMKRWNTCYAGKPAFTAIANGYRCGNLLRKRHQAHRVIWAMVTGEWPHDDIDHLNGIRSDNRWSNLRSVTRSMNRRNVAKNPRNKSGINGVCWDAGTGKWRAHIGLGHKRIHLGRFDDIADVVAARTAAESGHGFTKRHGT